MTPCDHLACLAVDQIERAYRISKEAGDYQEERWLRMFGYLQAEQVELFGARWKEILREAS